MLRAYVRGPSNACSIDIEPRLAPSLTQCKGTKKNLEQSKIFIIFLRYKMKKFAPVVQYQSPPFPSTPEKKERTFTPAEVRLVFGELGGEP